MAAITTTSYNQVSQFASQTPLEFPYLFPFSASCQKSDQSRWDPQTLSDLGGVVDELVGTELENKQAPNEGGDVKANIVVVNHVEKSVIAWRSVKREEVSWAVECLKHISKLGGAAPGRVRLRSETIELANEPQAAKMTQSSSPSAQYQHDSGLETRDSGAVPLRRVASPMLCCYVHTTITVHKLFPYLLNSAGARGG